MTDVQKVMQYYSVDEATARQALALAPASSLAPRTTSAGVSMNVSTFFVVGGLIFLAGMILAPSALVAGKAGSERIARTVERKIRG